MTYTILLAQKIAIEHNLGLDLLELTVITELKKLTSNTAWQNAAVKHTDGNLYFLFRLSYIIELVPLVFINNNGIDAKIKALRRILVELEKKGFLVRADFNREKGGNYCHITSKSDILISDTITKNGNAPLPKVSTTITKNGNAPLPELDMYTSTNTQELNKENNSAENQKKSEIVGKNKTLPLNNKKEKNELPQKDLAPVVLDNSNIANTEDFVYFHELFDPEQNDNILEWLQKSEYQNENLCPQRIFDYINQNDRHKGRKKYYQWKSTISAALAFKRNDGKLKEFFGKNINQQANEQTDFATRITNSLAAQAERDANNPLFN